MLSRIINNPLQQYLQPLQRFEQPIIMQQQHSTTQQSQHPILQYETQAMHVTIAYFHKIQYHRRSIQAKIYIVPKLTLYNAPLEIELKGYFFVKNTQDEQNSLLPPSIGALEITESFVFEKEDRLQKKEFINRQGQESEGKTQSQLKGQKDVQFLSGCQVLYQLDEVTKKRLQILQQNIEYTYPVQFDLPDNIPQSIDQFILKGIYLTVKYQLNVSIRSIQVQTNKRGQELYVLPFTILPEEKNYPYEELVLKQKIKCYHQQGKILQIQKQVENGWMRCLRRICPRIMDPKMFSSKFSHYDLYHLELVAIVSKNNNIFLVARAYREPEEKMMSVTRDKQTSETTYKEMSSMVEMSHEASLATIKESEIKAMTMGIKKVEVEMYGQLLGFPQQLLLKKTITLNNEMYDMIEGQIMINLDEYLPFPKSCKSDLFTLTYDFKIKGSFIDHQQQNSIEFEDYVVQSHRKEFIL